MENSTGRNKRRFFDLAWVSFANGLVIFIAIYCRWSLFEVALVYTGEIAILLLVTLARLFAATRLGQREPRTSFRWRFWDAKLSAIGIALLMYPLLVGFLTVALFAPKFDFGLVSEGTLHWLALCWLGFFISHAVAFVSLARCGAYETLIADHRVMMPFLRYLPLLVAAIGISSAREFGTDVAPWFYVLVLAMLAVVNVTSHFVEVDALRVTPGVPQDAQPAE